ncbi:hypothetical protein DPEC_G00293470 [Dallia pectoralis]|uniref:Uncharacterized protein n=1 Tax=Dallia pectoralis TaxID=75939 RepID=A0ACC2FI86_DALPE|nr:hypothetical protein DPEC_G00293470 [Dallia pectoralis]
MLQKFLSLAHCFFANSFSSLALSSVLRLESPSLLGRTETGRFEAEAVALAPSGQGRPHQQLESLTTGDTSPSPSQHTSGPATCATVSTWPSPTGTAHRARVGIPLSVSVVSGNYSLSQR